MLQFKIQAGGRTQFALFPDGTPQEVIDKTLAERYGVRRGREGQPEVPKEIGQVQVERQPRTMLGAFDLPAEETSLIPFEPQAPETPTTMESGVPGPNQSPESRAARGALFSTIQIPDATTDIRTPESEYRADRFGPQMEAPFRGPVNILGAPSVPPGTGTALPNFPEPPPPRVPQQPALPTPDEIAAAARAKLGGEALSELQASPLYPAAGSLLYGANRLAQGVVGLPLEVASATSRAFGGPEVNPWAPREVNGQLVPGPMAEQQAAAAQQAGFTPGEPMEQFVGGTVQTVGGALPFAMPMLAAAGVTEGAMATAAAQRQIQAAMAGDKAATDWLTKVGVNMEQYGANLWRVNAADLAPYVTPQMVNQVARPVYRRVLADTLAGMSLGYAKGGGPDEAAQEAALLGVLGGLSSLGESTAELGKATYQRIVNSEWWLKRSAQNRGTGLEIMDRIIEEGTANGESVGTVYAKLARIMGTDHPAVQAMKDALIATSREGGTQAEQVAAVREAVKKAPKERPTPQPQLPEDVVFPGQFASPEGVPFLMRRRKKPAAEEREEPVGPRYLEGPPPPEAELRGKPRTPPPEERTPSGKSALDLIAESDRIRAEMEAVRNRPAPVLPQAPGTAKPERPVPFAPPETQAEQVVQAEKESQIGQWVRVVQTPEQAVAAMRGKPASEGNFEGEIVSVTTLGDNRVHAEILTPDGTKQMAPFDNLVPVMRPEPVAAAPTPPSEPPPAEVPPAPPVVAQPTPIPETQPVLPPTGETKATPTSVADKDLEDLFGELDKAAGAAPTTTPTPPAAPAVPVAPAAPATPEAPVAPETPEAPKGATKWYRELANAEEETRVPVLHGWRATKGFSPEEGVWFGQDKDMIGENQPRTKQDPVAAHDIEVNKPLHVADKLDALRELGIDDEYEKLLDIADFEDPTARVTVNRAIAAEARKKGYDAVIYDTDYDVHGSKTASMQLVGGPLYDAMAERQNPSLPFGKAPERKPLIPPREPSAPSTSWKRYFGKEAIESANAQIAFKSRSTVAFMRPNDFLAMAEKGESPDKTERVQGMIAKGEPFSTIPRLSVEVREDGTAKVASHEGRHRMRELAKLGVESVPVEIKTEGQHPIRWGEQGNIYDKLDVAWPTKLEAQAGAPDPKATIPFPESVVHNRAGEFLPPAWHEKETPNAPTETGRAPEPVRLGGGERAPEEAPGGAGQAVGGDRLQHGPEPQVAVQGEPGVGPREGGVPPQAAPGEATGAAPLTEEEAARRLKELLAKRKKPMAAMGAPRGRAAAGRTAFSSRPSLVPEGLDEELYAEMQPLLKVLWDGAKAKKQDMPQFVASIQQMLGEEWRDALPYLKRYIKEAKDAETAGTAGPQPVGPDGEKPLADVPPQPVPGPGGEGAPVPGTGEGAGGRGGGGGEAGGVLPGPGAPGAPAGGGHGPGTGTGEVHPPTTGEGEGVRGPEPGAGEPVAPPPATPPTEDFRILPEHDIGGGTPGVKFDRNMSALGLLKALRTEGRSPTAEERIALARYVGWGMFKSVFDPWRYRTTGDPGEELTDPQAIESTNEKRKAELYKALGEEQYKAARASIKNAHYTAPVIVESIWKALRDHFGFKGGKYLEPSAGVGTFLGLIPDELQKVSRATAVELDPTTGDILQYLYPKQGVRIMGFQELRIPPDFYDLALGNVPFGDEGSAPFDKAYRKDPNPSTLHDYFFLKALDKVRPGGVVAFITSTGTLGRRRADVREWLAQRANLVGAIKMPGSTFKKNAGTEVTTDLVILRKLMPGELPSGETWTKSVEAGITDTRNFETKPLFINEYFKRHPEMVLGNLGPDKMYVGRLGLTPYLDPNGDPISAEEFARRFDEALRKMPGNVFVDTEAQAQENAPERIEVAGTSMKEGAWHIDDKGIIYRYLNGVLVKPEMKARQREIVRGLYEISGLTREVLRVQKEGNEEDLLKASRKSLERAYDAFVARNGVISNPSVFKLYLPDNDVWLLVALEKEYEPAIYEKTATGRRGKLVTPAKAKKADIFFKRVIPETEKVATPDNPGDALAVSLRTFGKVDLGYIQQALPELNKDQILTELKGRIFYDLETKDWVARDEFLSGRVVDKLELYREAAKVDEQYLDYVKELELVQPDPTPASRIFVRLGTPWIDPKYIVDWIHSYPGGAGRRIVIVHSDKTATWVPYGVPPIPQLGTKSKPFSDLLEAALNHRQVVVWEKDPDGNKVRNEKETLAAQAKVEELHELFGKWAFEDDDRAQELVEAHDKVMNREVLREYDGSHLMDLKSGRKMPGLSDAKVPRNYQLDGVWRVVTNGNTLFAWDVGLGKSLAMFMASQELKRLGIKKKILHVVPNHMVASGQYAREFKQAYPEANILAANAHDLKKENRRAFQGRIATGTWDAVILPHSQFTKIPVSKALEKKYIQQQLDELAMALKEAQEAEEIAKGGGRKGKKGGQSLVAQIEGAIKALETRLEKLLNSPDRDDVITWEEMGFDMVFIDEAHNFKRLAFPSKMDRVAGLAKGGSQRASDLHMKLGYLAEQYPGNYAVFSTGTPISNTLAEAFTVMRYLDPEGLQDAGIQNFDAWAHQFGEVVTGVEPDTTGRSFRINKSFKRFRNANDLGKMWQKFVDVRTQEEVKLPIPQMRGGKMETISVRPSQEQKQQVDKLLDRLRAIKTGKVDPKEDNNLKVTIDGRKASLDMRLIDPNAPDYPGSKLHLAADEIKKLYDQWEEDKGVALVFIDFSCPRKSLSSWAGASAIEGATTEWVDLAREPEEIDLAQDEEEDQDAVLDRYIAENQGKFSAYDDLKQKLIDRGVPEREIQFIHHYPGDEEKAALLDRVRSGQVRVLMGSTPKMGEGVNMQDRVVGVVNVDAPWRPDQIIQRNGRGLRWGNRLFEKYGDKFRVAVMNFVTAGMFDAYMWGVMLRKANFVQTLSKRGDLGDTLEDVGDFMLDAASATAAAADDPDQMAVIAYQAEETKLLASKSGFVDQLRALRQDVERIIPNRIAGWQAQLAIAEERLAKINPDPVDDGFVTVVVNGKPIETAVPMTNEEATIAWGRDALAGKKGEYSPEDVEKIRRAVEAKDVGTLSSFAGDLKEYKREGVLGAYQKVLEDYLLKLPDTGNQQDWNDPGKTKAVEVGTVNGLPIEFRKVTYLPTQHHYTTTRSQVGVPVYKQAFNVEPYPEKMEGLRYPLMIGEMVTGEKVVFEPVSGSAVKVTGKTPQTVAKEVRKWLGYQDVSETSEPKWVSGDIEEFNKYIDHQVETGTTSPSDAARREGRPIERIDLRVPGIHAAVNGYVVSPEKTAQSLVNFFGKTVYNWMDNEKKVPRSFREWISGAEAELEMKKEALGMKWEKQDRLDEVQRRLKELDEKQKAKEDIDFLEKKASAYYIRGGNGDWFEAEGAEPVTIIPSGPKLIREEGETYLGKDYGISTFLYTDGTKWGVYHTASGSPLSRGLDRQQVIKRAWDNLAEASQRVGWGEVKKQLQGLANKVAHEHPRFQALRDIDELKKKKADEAKTAEKTKGGGAPRGRASASRSRYSSRAAGVPSGMPMTDFGLTNNPQKIDPHGTPSPVAQVLGLEPTKIDVGPRHIDPSVMPEDYYPIELPELVEFLRRLSADGTLRATVKRRLSRKRDVITYGLFVPSGAEPEWSKILLRAATGNPEHGEARWDPLAAATTLAHEIGHWIGYMPDGTFERGTILGHIAALVNYGRHSMPWSTWATPILKTEERTMKKLVISDLKQKLGRKPTPEEVSSELYKRMEATGRLPVQMYQIKRELMSGSAYIRPWDRGTSKESFIKYRDSNEELYADGVSLIFIDPRMAKTLMPNFWSAFWGYIKERPAAWKAFKELQELYANPDNLAAQRGGRWDQGFAKFESILNEDAKVRAEEESWKNLFKEFGKDMGDWLFDTYQDLARYASKAKKIGQPFDPNADPLTLFRDFVYSTGKQRHFLLTLMHDVFDPLENELGYTSKTEAWNDFGRILAMDRIWGERYDKWNPLGTETKAARIELRRIENTLGPERWGKILDLADKFRDLWHNWLIPELDEDGLLSPRLKEYIALNGEFYAKFHTVEGLLRDLATEGGLQMALAPIRRQLGTLQEIGNPALTTVLHGLALIRAGAYNRALRISAREIQRRFGPDVRNIPTKWDANVKGHVVDMRHPAPKGMAPVYFKENGKTAGVWVPERLQKTFTERPAKLYKMIQWGLVFPLHAVFVGYNPGFTVWSLIKDTLGTMKKIEAQDWWERAFPPLLIARYGKQMIRAFPKAWRTEVGPFFPGRKEFQEMMKEIQAGNIQKALHIWFDFTEHHVEYDKFVEMMYEEGSLFAGQQRGGTEFSDESEIQRQLGRFGLVAPIAPHAVWRTLGYPFAKWSQIASAAEKVNKIAPRLYYESYGPKLITSDLFARDTKRGLTRRNIINKVRRQMGNPDYQSKARYSSFVGVLQLFYNAQKEGFRSEYEAASERPLEYAYRTFWYAIAPKLLMLMMAAGMLGKKLKDKMEAVSEWDKTNYVVIPIGTTTNGRTVYARIPLDHMGQLIGGLIWKTYSKDVGGLWQGLLAYGAGQFGSPSPWVDIAAEIALGLVGQNYYHTYQQRWAIPTDLQESRASGKVKWPTVQAYAMDIWNQTVGSTTFTFKNENAEKLRGEIETAFDKALGLPILGKFLNRFVKVSDQGYTDDLRPVVEKAEASAKADKYLARRELRSIIKENPEASAQEVWDSFISAMRKDGTLPRLAVGTKQSVNASARNMIEDINQQQAKSMPGKTGAYYSLYVNTDTAAGKAAIIGRAYEKMDLEDFFGFTKLLGEKGELSPLVILNTRTLLKEKGVNLGELQDLMKKFEKQGVPAVP